MEDVDNNRPSSQRDLSGDRRVPMTNHTPGPWHECNNGRCSCGLVWSIPGDFPVCTVSDDKRHNLQVIAVAHEHMADAPDLIYQTLPREQCVANARLIAAAPDMLAALRTMLNAIGNYPVTSVDEAERIALAVLAKVEGK